MRKQKLIEELLAGYNKFEGSDKVVTDKEVYDVIMAHSRIIDRLNPAKMVYMTLQSVDYLYFDPEKAKRTNWLFFKKRGATPVKFKDL